MKCPSDILESIANGDFNSGQIQAIEAGLKSNLDVRKYANPKYSRDIMNAIRIGMDWGVHDMYKYAHLGEESMYQIRLDHAAGVQYD